MSWIDPLLKLESDRVLLIPYEEKHFVELISAGQEEIIWTYMPAKATDEELFRTAMEEALLQKEKEEQFPFVVIDKKTGKLIGSTRFLKINEEHRNLEIGWTWYQPAFWGTGYNEECKLLLLNYCFETLKTIRVQITAAEKNTRSRKAILRIGATFEGILRHLVIRNGDKRSAAYYSILEEEWPLVKQKLLQLIRERKGSGSVI